MKTLRNLVLTAGLIGLGGCTAFTSFSEVDALNEAQAVGSPFTQALSAEYRDFANRELKEMFDYPDALHFARKGLAAAAGETVLPEPVSDWNLKKDHIQELSIARGRLMTVFDLGAREIVPSLSAKAQSKFDCWIEQQEEKWQSEEIDGCKVSYLELISEIENSIQPPAPKQEVIIPTQPVEVEAAPMAPEDAMYLVFFNWDSSKIGTGAMNVLEAVSDEVKKNPPEKIVVAGHADTSGSKEYNAKLSLRRANNVKKVLVDLGVPADKVEVISQGETELLVATPDNVREPANRRVNISFK